MNKIYYNILNEVLKVYDFDSWDKDFDQTFKNDIKTNLSRKDAVEKWWSSGYDVSWYVEPLSRDIFAWERPFNVYKWAKANGYRDLIDINSHLIATESLIVAWIIYNAFIKYGWNGNKMAEALNNSDIFMDDISVLNAKDEESQDEIVLYILKDEEYLGDDYYITIHRDI